MCGEGLLYRIDPFASNYIIFHYKTKIFILPYLQMYPVY